LTMSTAGGSGSLTVATGNATDSTNTVSMTLAAAMTKNTTLWAAGNNNGGLDAGLIANSTWYYWYLILNPATGATDILFSLSSTNPTIPSGFINFRRIGCAKTDGSAHWTAFTQDGDTFMWSTPVADIAANNPGTSAVTRTLTTPPGLKLFAILQVGADTTTFNIGGFAGNNCFSYFSDLSLADIAPSSIVDVYVGAASAMATSGVWQAFTVKQVRTNGSSQIRSRMSSSDASTNIFINTLGWVDNRGKNT